MERTINKYLEALQEKFIRYEQLQLNRNNFFRIKDFESAKLLEKYEIVPLQQQIRLLIQRTNYLIENCFSEEDIAYDEF